MYTEGPMNVDDLQALEVMINPQNTLSIDIVMLQLGGILVNIEKVPYLFCKDVDELKQIINKLLDTSFSQAKPMPEIRGKEVEKKED